MPSIAYWGRLGKKKGPGKAARTVSGSPRIVDDRPQRPGNPVVSVGERGCVVGWVELGSARKSLANKVVAGIGDVKEIC